MTTPTSRLLRLLSLLQTRRDWPGQVLAERLEISPRTVRRDVDHLREMGYRVTAIKGPDGGYRLDAGSELPPMLFDDEQAVALAVALQATAVSGIGIDEAAARALTTVRQVMPARLRHRIDDLDVTAVPAPGASAVPPIAPEVLMTVSAAIRRCEVLRFDYGRDASDGPGRRAEPHHVVTTSGRWYLVAWDLDKDEWRIFRLDRIRPRMPTGRRFTPRVVPGGDVADYVAARFKGSDQTNAWPCVGEVTLALPASEVAPFAGDGIVTDLGPDRSRLTAGSWSWVALAASFGRFDVDIDAVTPVELADAFGVLADRYARASATGLSAPTRPCRRG
ncbi:helix-turn-helix transcriptional regulator [Cellulomonas sp. P22]|uniref:helix-turn-helix transcriptional regulator n=1 Tax=Cellulomonas sp. P22 TaxID=3373189 RepID=UPI0037A8707A